MVAATSSGSSHVTVDVRPGGYAVVTIAKEPVNSFDLAMWSALEQALQQLERTPGVRAVIFTSGLAKDIFTAGNDLGELYAPRTSLERYRAFWTTQNRFLVALHRSPLATVAAIRGACPAGGCAIALCCDARLMTAQGSIGLNEVLLGIPVPKYWGLLMGRVIGPGAADRLLLPGALIAPPEALRLGLVDSLTEGGSEGLLAAAKAAARRLAKLPAQAYAETKLNMRQEFCAAWEAYYPAEVDGAWRFLASPETVQVLGGAMRRLSSKPRPTAAPASAATAGAGGEGGAAGGNTSKL